MKNKLSPIFFLFTLIITSVIQGQTIVFEDNSHVFFHELQGDSVIITVEDLNDQSLDLSNDGNPSKVDKITFMFDIDQTGLIDAGSGTDVFYTNDFNFNNNVCKGDIVSNNSLSACGNLTTAATLSASLKRTIASNTEHVVYQIIIPKSELHTSSQVCARASVRIDNIDGPSVTTTKLPSSADSYFVKEYFPVNLFEAVDLGDEIQFCTGDSITATTSYPSYLWSDNSSSSFMTPTDYGDAHLIIKDNTCSMSDTVNVVVQDENYCSNINLRFPNIVTPNNNGINDNFEPLANKSQHGMDYTGVELNIYNRWGVKVGGKKGQAPFWDCHLDWGQKAPSGTYYYVYNAGATTVNGFFTVLYTEK